MAWDEIKFRITADMDFGDAASQVETIKNGIKELKDNISEMPNVSRIMDNSFERSASVAENLVSKLNKLQQGEMSDSERAKVEKEANNNILELNALRDIQLGTTDLSTRIAKQWFGNLPKSIQHQFDAMAPQVAAIIRNRMSTLSKAGNGITAGNPGAVAKILMGNGIEEKMDAGLKQLINKYKLTQKEKDYFDDFLKYLIPSTTPLNRTTGYQLKRYGGTRSSNHADLFAGKKPEDLFPESYRKTFTSQGMSFNNFDKSYQNFVLDIQYRKKLNEILRTNPIAVKAALASGISRRDERGVLETKDEISRHEWENFRKELYDDMILRVSGYKGNAFDAYKATGKNKKTLMSRLTSSSSGRAMLAMQDIEDMEKTNAWINAAGVNSWSKLNNEGKRILNQHVVSKFTPFLDSQLGSALDPEKSRKVMISESHNTRLLGNNSWKNNQDVSDTIAIVSLAGYDAKNPLHQKALDDLFTNGRQIGGGQYVAQSIHGTGNDTIIRMIEKRAFDRVNEQERQWIQNHPDEAVRGIRGTYWGNFEDEEINRLIQEGINGKKGITGKDWGKHIEALNKPWTPTQEVGINIDGKRFAVVDTKKFGDGGAWFSSNVMPHSGQFRGGIGLKGSAFVFDGKDVRAFGRKTGLIDGEGRLMAEGPDGKMYDISGYDGIIPMDVIKNKGILKDENGNFVSGDIASRRITALLGRHPMSYHVDYDIEDKKSGHIGSQMASFMMLSPEVRQHQIEMAMKVMNELDTEAGQLKHVFGNQDDYLSRAVNDDTSLLATVEARSRVDSKRASILQDLLGGNYTDYDDDSQIVNLRAVANPLSSMIMANGGKVPDSVIKQARYYLQKDAEQRLKDDPNYVAPQYTDQDIRDMIVLQPGTVIDFNRKDQSNVSVIRSPTGYGNLYNAKNLAAAAEPIYRGMGLPMNSGIYLSEVTNAKGVKDTDILQSLDFDADQVKVIYDQAIAKGVEEATKTMQYEKSDIEGRGIEYTQEQLQNRAIQNRLFTERSLSAPLGMGTGSSGIRIMQIDYSNPANKMLVKAAQRAAGIYDIASIINKSAEEYELEDGDPIWKLLGLGKEYTKFSDKIDDLFKLDDDMMDEYGNAIKNHPDLLKTSNGQLVNLRTLRNMKIDEINLPSRFMANHLMGITAANKLYRHGLIDTTKIDAVYEAMDKNLDFGDAGPQRKKLMQTMRLLHTQFGIGERAMITDSEGRYIQQLIDAANAEIELSANDFYDPTTNKYIKDGKKYDSKEGFIAAQKTRYGIRTAENALGQMGIKESYLVDMFGKDYVEEHFKNATTSVGTTEFDKMLELQQQKEENTREIEEARQQQTPKPNKTQRKKLQKEQTTLDREIKNLADVLGLREDVDIENEIKEQERIVATAKANYDENRLLGDNKAQDILDEQNEARLVGLNKYKELIEKRNTVNQKLNPTQHIDALLAKQKEIDAEIESNNKMMAIQSEYNQIMSDVNEYGNMLWGRQKGKENKINDSKTAAEKYWTRSFYDAQNRLDVLDAFETKINEDESIPKEAKERLWQGIDLAKQKINENFHKDFVNQAILNAKSLSEDISAELDKEENAPTAQKRKLDNYDKQITDAKSYIKKLNDELYSGKLEAKDYEMYENGIKETNKYIENAETAKANLVETYTKENEQAGREALEELQIKHGIRNKHSAKVISAKRKEEIQTVRSTIDKQYKEGNYSDEEYQKISSDLDKIDKRANPAMIELQQGIGAVQGRLRSTAGYLMNMFSRQLFNSAISEVKRFVKEFNQQMTTIQMITLKSDTEMSNLGSGLIKKAKELKISISEISQSAATLYRQGLTDEEVNSRLETISKFSKVSGAKVEDATKLITVAMQTGLVSSPELAADIVTALGDNAATNAQQIEKGIEKAGAAAAADGTTFAELASMLTAITATTQIGGNVAGRTLNTIIGRMNKIGTEELIYDENGNAISGSAVAKLLKSQGIDMYDKQGNKKSTYQTLYELSQKWEGLSDAEQQQLATAIAGTRQYSNFAAIMQGMSEGKVDEYMKLAEGASGTVGKKFEIYTESLEASLTNLRNTFDDLVNDLTDSGALSGIINFFSGLIEGVDNLVESIGGLGAALVSVLPMFTSMMLMSAGMQTGKWELVGIGAGALATSAVITSLLGNLNNKKSKTDLYNENVDFINDSYNAKKAIINEAKALNEKSNRTSEEDARLQELMGQISETFDLGDSADSMNELGEAINSASSEAQAASKSIKDYAETIKEAEKQNEDSRIKSLAFNRYDWAKGAAEDFSKQRHAIENDENIYGGQSTRYLFQLDENNKLDKERFKEVAKWDSGVLGQAVYDAKYNGKPLTDEEINTLAMHAASTQLFGSGSGTVGNFLQENIGKSGLFRSIVGEGRANYFDNMYGSTWGEEKDAMRYIIRKAMATPDLLTEEQNELLSTKYAYNRDESLEKAFNSWRSGNWDENAEFFWGIFEQYLPKYIESSSIKNIDRENAEEIFKNVISSYLPDLDQEELSASVKQAASDFLDYSKEYNYQDALLYVLDDIFKFSAGNETKSAITNAYEEYMYRHDETSKFKRMQAKSHGLAEDKDFYIDQNGKRYTLDEAIAQIENERSEMYQAVLPLVGERTNKINSEQRSRIAEAEKLIQDFDNDADTKNRYIRAIVDKDGNINLLGEISQEEVDKKTEGITLSNEKRKALEGYATAYYGSHGQFLGYGSAGAESRLAESSQIDYDLLDTLIRDQKALQYSEASETEKIYDAFSLFTVVQDTLEDTGKTLSDMVSEISTEDLLNTYKIFPETIESILSGARDIGDDALKGLIKTSEELQDLYKNKSQMSGYKDYFMSGVATGNREWEQKNQYGLTADWAIRLIHNRGLDQTNRQGALEVTQALADLVNLSDSAEWATLNTNEEFAHVMSQIQRDDRGQITYAPPDIIDQIMSVLYKNSYSYQKTPLSTYEKGQNAQDLFTGIMTGITFATKDEVEENAEYAEELRKERRRHEDSIYGGDITAEGEREALNEDEVLQRWIKNRGFNIASEADKKYLEDALGSDLYGKVFLQRGKLNVEDINLAQTKINNAMYGISGLTDRQKYEGIQRTVSAIKNKTYKGIEDVSAYDEYMSGFGRWGEYKEMLAKGETNEELQQAFENYIRTYEVKFKVSGISDLEEAGKVLDGTAQKIEALQKGGSFAIKARLELENEAYSNSQLGAKLFNGSRAEQIEALTSLGFNETAIAKDFEGTLSAGQRMYDQTIAQQQAGTFDAWLANTKTSNEAEDVIRYANSLGYYLDENRKFVKKSNPNVEHKSAFFNAKPQFSDAELSRARMQIINGELTEGDLYEAAAASMGQYGQAYMTLKDNNQNPSDGLKQLALYEANESTRANAQEYRAQAIDYQKALLATNGPRNEANISALASYLNLDEQQINDLSQDDLLQKINEKQENLMRNIVENLGKTFDSIDFSNVTDFNSLISTLQSEMKNADEETASIIQTYIDAFKGVSDAASQSFGEAYDSALINLNESTYERQGLQFILKYLDEAIAHGKDYGLSPVESFKGIGGWKSDWNSSVFGNENTVSALSLLDQGAISEDQFRNYISTQLSGEAKGVDYYASLGQMLFGNMVDSTGNFIVPQSQEQIDSLLNVFNMFQDNADFRTLFNEYTSGVSDFSDVISRLKSKDIKGVQDVFKAINDEMNNKRASEITKYNKAAANTSQILTKLKKGGKDADEGIAMLRSDFKALQDQATAVTKAKGKAGKDLTEQERGIIAGMFEGIDADAIKQMTAEELDDLLSDVGTDINQQFTDTLQSAIDASPVELNLGNVNVGVNGEINLEDLAQAYRDAGDFATAQALELAGHYADIDFLVSEDGQHISVDAVVNASKKYNSKGGGGGGGKSKVDKLLEDQKHKLAQLQHEQKMLEIKEKDYDYSNDFEASRQNYSDQIEVQQRLAAQYRENISEVKELLKTIKEGTDDWWKATEAINSYEEALASINSAINEINSKNIKLLEEQQKLADTPGTHVQSMLEKLATRAMSEDRFSDFERLTENRINEIRAQKDLNNVQITEWEAQLKNFEENSDSWLEIRDKIWALEEENADLENQALQQTVELNQQRLSQIGKILQENTQTATHNQNIATTYGDYYQNGGYRTEYENMIRIQQGSNAVLLAENKAAEQSALAQMSTLQENTTAWFEAQAAVYSYQEAIAQAEVTQAQLNRTLAESNIEAVNEKYTDATRELVHVNDLLKNQAQEYLNTNDYDAYFEAMGRVLENIPDLIDEATTKLNDLQAIYDNGMSDGTLDLTMQRNLLDQINEAESERQSLILEQRQTQRDVNKANLDMMFERQNFNESNYEHNLKLVGYEASKYQNAGELTNYGNMIEAETKLRKDRVKVLKDELVELEAQHENFKDGSEEEERIVDAIKKHEEAIASENTQIDKNNKLLEENQKKIMQVQKTLENAVDKEIEDNKRRKREILAANVSMQDTIVNLLKKRLQDEWALRKKDLEKEKESLNEYKKLISERFNYRKKAAQQADKDEELADYRRQLALIEADPTRTKEAKELRRKIEEMEKEQAWTVAEDELNAENERVDQNIEGIDKFVSYNEELLNEILSDANNFADEMNEIINGSFEESYEKIIAFMQAENEAFMKSLPMAQQQMIQSWEDTWKKANDILDNNYQEISNILYDENGNLLSEEEVVNWFKENDRMYRDYIENGDTLNAALAERGWQESYRNVVAALKNTAEFTPDDHTLGDVVSKLDELADGIFKVNIVDVNGTAIGPYGLDGEGGRYTDFSNGEGYTLNDYAGIGKVVIPEPAQSSSGSSSSGGSGSGQVTTNKKYVVVAYGGSGSSSSGFAQQSYEIWAKSEEDARRIAKSKYIKEGATITSVTVAGTGYVTKNTTPTVSNKTYDFEEELKKQGGLVAAEGGLINYTGPAWVDGTRTHPESFLDATDTALLREQLNAFDRIKNSPYMSYIDPSMYGNNTNVGDVNITINQAELKSDADINKLAKQVGQAFTRELKINGVSMTGYAFA